MGRNRNKRANNASKSKSSHGIKPQTQAELELEPKFIELSDSEEEVDLDAVVPDPPKKNQEKFSSNKSSKPSSTNSHSSSKNEPEAAPPKKEAPSKKKNRNAKAKQTQKREEDIPNGTSDHSHSPAQASSAPESPNDSSGPNTNGAKSPQPESITPKTASESSKQANAKSSEEAKVESEPETGREKQSEPEKSLSETAKQLFESLLHAEKLAEAQDTSSGAKEASIKKKPASQKPQSKELPVKEEEKSEEDKDKHEEQPVEKSSKEEPQKDEVKKDTSEPEVQKKSSEKSEKDEDSKDPIDEKEYKPQGDCAVCGQLAKSFCSSCKHVFYCKRDHQKSHWKSHKDQCKEMKKLPYRIERNDHLGRHLVATRHIQAGELFLEESPLVVGPRQLTKPVCLGCHQELRDPTKVRRCSRCSWPLCSRKCEDSKLHEPECRLIRYGGSKVNVETFGQINMMYACITVLRALALQDGPTSLWKEYTQFDSHLEQRMKTEVYTKVNKEKVVFFIHHYLRLLSKFSDLEILETCGRLDTNCFEIRQHGLNLRAMYRHACLMAHDCRPNTRHIFDMNNNIKLFATVDIAKDSVISASYTQPLWNTLNRQFGSYMSAVSCNSCGGRVLPTQPLDSKAAWECDRCGQSVDASVLTDLHANLTAEIKQLDRSDPTDLEQWMKTCAPILPDTHQLVKEVQYGLICIFKFDQPELLNSNQLLRKSVLCKELLDLADKIDPGLTKWRGELLFEMQTSAVILAQRAVTEKKITDQQAKEIYAENLGYLREAESILCVEDEYKAKIQRDKLALEELLET